MILEHLKATWTRGDVKWQKTKGLNAGFCKTQQVNDTYQIAPKWWWGHSCSFRTNLVVCIQNFQTSPIPRTRDFFSGSSPFSIIWSEQRVLYSTSLVADRRYHFNRLGCEHLVKAPTAGALMCETNQLAMSKLYVHN